MTSHDPDEDGRAQRRGRDPVAALWSSVTTRARCAALLRAVEDGRSGWFRLQREHMPELVARVAAALGEAQPPDAATATAPRPSAGAADLRAQLDLSVIRVLLDVAAPAGWAYAERDGARIDGLALPGERQARDELLALLDRVSGAGQAAPLRTAAPTGPAADDGGLRRHAGAQGVAFAIGQAFAHGVFSSDANDPMRVDGRALTRLDSTALRAVFQCTPGLVMPGLDTRADVLRRLGSQLERSSPTDGALARPSQLLDGWLAQGEDIDAAELLGAMARNWSAAWAQGGHVLGMAAGDTWPHRWAGAATGLVPAAAEDPQTAGWVPFHGPLQRMIEGFIEPLDAAGLRLLGLEALTPPADAAMCSLLLQSGVVVPREARDLAPTRRPGDELVVELRGLCVALLDEVAREVSMLLGGDARATPPAVWRAARTVAQGAAPRLRIEPGSALP